MPLGEGEEEGEGGAVAPRGGEREGVVEGVSCVEGVGEGQAVALPPPQPALLEEVEGVEVGEGVAL